MPFGSTIADFMAQKRAEDEAKKSNRWGKIMGVAGLAKDIWGTLNANKQAALQRQYELEDVAPGSAKEQSALRLKQGESDIWLKGNQAWLDYQNKNPGKPAAQLEAEFYLTPEGKKVLDDADARARAQSDYETANRIKEIRAGQSSAMGESAWTTYEKAVSSAQEKFLTVGADGGITYKPGTTFEMVRDFLFGFANQAYGVDEKDIPALKMQFERFARDPYFDALRGGDSASGTTLTPPPQEAPRSQDPAGDLAKIKQTLDKYVSAGAVIVPKDLGQTFRNLWKFANPPDQMLVESTLESVAAAMADSDPTAARAYDELAQTGVLNVKRLSEIYSELFNLLNKKPSVPNPSDSNPESWKGLLGL